MPPPPAREAFNPDLNKAKLEQAILFFLTYANNAHLGKTKLMKLLYYADFDHFEKFDVPITGARYRKLPHGPVPDDAANALDALVRAGKVSPRSVQMGRYTQERLDPLAEPDLRVFTAEETDTLHEVVRRWSEHTTARIEAATHGEAPWIAVKPNAIIPYHLAYYRNNYGAMELDEDELVAPDTDESLAMATSE